MPVVAHISTKFSRAAPPARGCPRDSSRCGQCIRWSGSHTFSHRQPYGYASQWVQGRRGSAKRLDTRRCDDSNGGAAPYGLAADLATGKHTCWGGVRTRVSPPLQSMHTRVSAVRQCVHRRVALGGLLQFTLSSWACPSWLTTAGTAKSLASAVVAVAALPRRHLVTRLELVGWSARARHACRQARSTAVLPPPAPSIVPGGYTSHLGLHTQEPYSGTTDAIHTHTQAEANAAPLRG